MRSRCSPRKPRKTRRPSAIRATSMPAITKRSTPAPSRRGGTVRSRDSWHTRGPDMWTNTLKPTDILSEEQVQQIHDHAMQILQEIGVDFLHPQIGRASCRESLE